MIITKLEGGLGNQQFQYATGRSLALKLGTNLKLDTTFYTGHPDRTYKLDMYSINAAIATSKEIAELKQTTPLRGWEKLIRRKKNSSNYYKERGFTYDASIFNQPDNTYLEGYWQSYKYFEQYKQQICSELTLQQTLSATAKTLEAEVTSCCSVALHIRRGDYVKNEVVNKYHGICSIDYYERSVRLIAKQANTEALRVYLFTDDVPWVKANLKLPYEMVNVEEQIGSVDHISQTIMSQCKHFVIANSTFSWWGAYLSGSPEKIVCAPKQWFAGANLDDKDLLPPSWHRL